jgi:hypothetical protein
MSEFGVALCPTTSAALRAEKLLLRAGVKVKLIPTPREFSSDCGMAVRFAWERVDEVRGILDGVNSDDYDIRQML